MIRNKKGSGAELLVEIIVSSIIFFVIVVFMFAVQLPQMELKAAAHVVSADAAMACELSLTNMLRANSSTGITYSDWLTNEYLQGKNLGSSSWKTEVEKIFDTSFSKGEWDLVISHEAKHMSLAMFGKIDDADKREFDIFSCTSFVPLQAAYSQFYCYWSGKKYGKDSQTVSFSTPDGDVNCIIIYIDQNLGLESGVETCGLDLEPKTVFDDLLPSQIEEDPNYVGDSIILPIKVSNVPYDIIVKEVSAKPANVSVTLTKRALIQDCALAVTLRTTNVSASGTLGAIQT